MSKKRKFGRIYDRHIEEIYRFVFLKVSSREVAEDITSQTFLKGWEVFKKESEKVKNFRSFLYQIARNLVIDHYRSRRQFLSPEDISLGKKDDLMEKAELNSELLKVKKGLEKLKGDYQDLIIWHYLEDIPIKEISNMLGKSEGSVRVATHRALNALQEKLEENNQ